MRLTKIHVNGYRRLVDTGCFIYGKLTAFVGPNEAGKSSLLAALETVNDPDEIPQRDRPRGRESVEDDAYIRLTFRLDDADLGSLPDLAVTEPPVSFTVQVKYNGSIYRETVPRLNRPSAMRDRARATTDRFSTTRAARELERSEDGDADGDILDGVLALLEKADDLTEDETHFVQTLIDLLPTTGLAGRTVKALSAWLTEQQPQDPHAVGARILYARLPVFALFGDSERALASDYHLPDVVNNTPAALDNLARLASLSLSKLHSAIHAQDVGAVETLTEHANARLREVFEAAWSQDPVHVRIKQDGWTLRVLVSTTVGGYSSIAERSDGLKTFVALTAFAARRKVAERPLILMIDEAEQHLHYDAQADVIRMLERQTVAQQVIYTTHSAGCLPSDLGTGVRPVLQAADGSAFSRIANSFWDDRPGFSPLLMAMGAGVAAVTPARYAVLAEGATEMLLLPTLVREATGHERLDYQVAPGIAGRTIDGLADLDLEAARVVYLVDGDAAGLQHSKNLKAAGIADTKIVSLGGRGSGLCLEEVLLVEPFLEAVNEAFLRRYGTGYTIKVAELSSAGGRYDAIKAWSKVRGVEPVSKTAIVTALVEQQAERLLSADGKRHVRRAHTAICAALSIPE